MYLPSSEILEKRKGYCNLKTEGDVTNKVCLPQNTYLCI